MTLGRAWKRETLIWGQGGIGRLRSRQPGSRARPPPSWLPPPPPAPPAHPSLHQLPRWPWYPLFTGCRTTETKPPTAASPSWPWPASSKGLLGWVWCDRQALCLLLLRGPRDLLAWALVGKRPGSQARASLVNQGQEVQSTSSQHGCGTNEQPLGPSKRRSRKELTPSLLRKERRVPYRSRKALRSLSPVTLQPLCWGSPASLHSRSSAGQRPFL